DRSFPLWLATSWQRSAVAGGWGGSRPSRTRSSSGRFSRTSGPPPSRPRPRPPPPPPPPTGDPAPAPAAGPPAGPPAHRRAPLGPARAAGPEPGRPAQGSAPLGQPRRSPRLDLSRGPAPRRCGEPPDARRPAPAVVRCVVTEAGGLVEEIGANRQFDSAIFSTAPRGPDAGCPGTMARKRGRPPTTLPCRTLG